MAKIPALITKRLTADPSAHVFQGKLFLYVSHDYDAGIPLNLEGDHFAMKDYYVYSMEDIYGSEPVTDHGLALSVEDVPWVSRQLWAPDAAYKDGKYYLYFPARDKENIFRIGVAVSEDPGGPFKADESYIPGTFSIDPASFTDFDQKTYLAWGGLHGGQLQCWQNKTQFDGSWSGQKEPDDNEYALSPQIALLSDDMHTLAEAPRDMVILAPETGQPIISSDKDRRYFEGPWIHRRGDIYYLSYSTGTTRYYVYATADNSYGPYTYQGRLLEPVSGWTTHGSIVEYKGQWWLFYHDSETNNGVDWLRQSKAKKIWYDSQAKIVFEDPSETNYVCA
ncbi:probable alpha-N-arabinofuranosidase / alpha-L-arabinofuranosidase [Fusarium fujikuroi]|uniref:Uncharacterized protein n=2 Tax=Fusarium fujikuroi TaxID=5127 RepID=A0A2H3SWB1_FUSFU|nr:probable alpha-N-arabinofuranosidase / alpha-L-arabinofuranosidase [Fusarium fujikuroi IMI 58289]KLP10541.1 putative alpha-N-arabinofuranosidase / alpha-L-arabinofuranosidase [Fusarium fujikuroi]CCT71064.1 probable alpha-N-arabinofuranosidase / alpha-L-arabinofuranosidase [Fusarium fujikuroi IMI 58289]SCN85575.1 probable alpha-N-arabinofuranosidase / alpha-L-arabinofuranosidase [Fusarium fujikuroi]SCN96238.1 probable alpha-N-arabinofuranosidase / alpha-L-arabinofuranosidase [Fusarium fujikur